MVGLSKMNFFETLDCVILHTRHAFCQPTNSVKLRNAIYVALEYLILICERYNV